MGTTIGVTELTEAELQIVRALRAMPEDRREEARRYIRSLRFRNPVIPADPEAARRLGEPGPPRWHFDPGELEAVEAFERECERAAVDG